MILGNPLALIGLATAIIIVLLYRRAQPSPQRTVTTGMLWDRVFADVSPRTDWLAKRDTVSCLFWLAILLLLVVAAAEPIVPAPNNTVVIIDNSIGMSAKFDASGTEGKTRLDRAKSLAGSLIERLRGADRMAIISGGDPVSLQVAMTGNQSLLQDAAESIGIANNTGSAAGLAGTDQIEIAITQAKSILESAGGGRIVVFTDGCFEGADKLAALANVEVVKIGDPKDNVMISRLAARRSAANPKLIELMLEAVGFTESPVNCPVEITMPDGSTESIEMQLSTAPSRKFFTYETGDAAEFQAKIKYDDAIPADNEAKTTVAPASLTRVYIPSLAFQQIWADDPLIVTIAERPPQTLTARSIALFCKQTPESLPDCPILLIDPQQSGPLWSVGPPLTREIELSYAPVAEGSEGAGAATGPDQPVTDDGSGTGGSTAARATKTLEEAIVGWCDTDSPLIDNIPLPGVVLEGARLLDATVDPEKVTILARSADGEAPLILKIDRDGAGPIVIITGDVFKQLGQIDAPITRWIARAPAILARSINTTNIDAEPKWQQAAANPPQLAEHDLRVTRIQSAPTEPTVIVPIDLSLWTYLSLAAAAMLIWEWRLYNRRWTN